MVANKILGLQDTFLEEKSLLIAEHQRNLEKLSEKFSPTAKELFGELKQIHSLLPSSGVWHLEVAENGTLWLINEGFAKEQAEIQTALWEKSQHPQVH